MARKFKRPVLARLPQADRAGVNYEKGCVTIEGVVSPRGQGGWPVSKQYDIHYFILADWCKDGEPLVGTPLTILRPVPPSDGPGGKYFNDFPEYSVARLNVLLSKDRQRAVVHEELTSRNPKKALKEVAARLREPVTRVTKRFGTLILNPRIEWFEGKIKWNGQSVRATFTRDEDGEVDDSVKTGEALWKAQVRWKKRIEDFIIEDLLPLKNESWLGEGEKELTPKEFKARMSLDSISLEPDGVFEFWYNDGDLFFGHSIQIRGTLADGPTDADIPG